MVKKQEKNKTQREFFTFFTRIVPSYASEFKVLAEQEPAQRSIARRKRLR